MDGSAIGTVTTFSGKTFPYGYVLADGSTYTQTAYPQGYAYAVAEATAGNALWTANTTAKTFTVPDLRDRFLLGSAAKAWGSKAGEESHLLSNAEMPVHSHGGATVAATTGVDDRDHVHSVVNIFASACTTGPAGFYSSSGSTNTGGRSTGHYHTQVGQGINGDGGGGAHNNMPPYCIVAMIVKIAGITVDPGSGIIQGPPGPAGGGQQVACRATRASNTNVALPANTWTKIPLDAPAGGGYSWDTAGMFDTPNGRIKITQAGKYQVNAEGYMIAVAGNGLYQVAIYKNGGQMAVSTMISTYATNVAPTVSDVIDCAVGDYLELYVASTVASSYQYNQNVNWMSAHLTQAVGPKGDQGAQGLGQALAVVYQTTTSRVANPQEFVQPRVANATVILPPAPPVGSLVAVHGGFAGVTIQSSSGDSIVFEGLGVTSVVMPDSALLPTIEFIYTSDPTYGKFWRVLSNTKPKGTILNTQSIAGNAEQYNAVAYNNSTAIPRGAGGLMQLTYTPTVPCWWEVTIGCGIVQKTDAAYHYMYRYIYVTPSDQDNQSTAYQLITQHSQVQTYEFAAVTRLFRLAAGTAYTANMVMGAGSGGSWQYHSGAGQLWMSAKAWAQ
jgi:microcystin-dependent protein